MKGELHQFPTQALDANSAVVTRIDSVLAIFRAIEAGEMLSAFPACESAQILQSAAVTLLALAEREVLCLREELGFGVRS